MSLLCISDYVALILGTGPPNPIPGMYVVQCHRVCMWSTYARIRCDSSVNSTFVNQIVINKYSTTNNDVHKKLDFQLGMQRHWFKDPKE